MVLKSLQGSGEPRSSGASSGLCFDNTVDLRGGERLWRHGFSGDIGSDDKRCLITIRLMPDDRKAAEISPD